MDNNNFCKKWEFVTKKTVYVFYFPTPIDLEEAKEVFQHETGLSYLICEKVIGTKEREEK